MIFQRASTLFEKNVKACIPKLKCNKESLLEILDKFDHPKAKLVKVCKFNNSFYILTINIFIM